MSARVFLDTNIFVHIVDPADPRKRMIARDLVAQRRQIGGLRIENPFL